MGLKAAISRTVSGAITSATLRGLLRARAAFSRRILGGKPRVHYFHQWGDPYSALAAAALDPLRARYDIDIQCHCVSPPDAAAAPEAERLAALAVRDAALLAKGLGIAPLGDPTRAGVPADGADARAEGDALRAKLGHYLGGMFYYESEWYWGLDRLEFLEVRLTPFRKANAPKGTVAPRREVTLAPVGAHARKPVFDFFLSFRSPYTYLAVPRVTALARHYGADLRLRFVLPMVMRGLPVPPSKRLYIVKDAKREAERLGMPFGRIVDPVGAGAERGLSVLHHAVRAGRGEEFALSFLQGAFADGIDAASDDGLLSMVTRAGLDAGLMRAALKDDSWRAVAEANRTELFSHGLWGVPSFRVDSGVAHWGQDRLWVIEEELRAAAEGKNP